MRHLFLLMSGSKFEEPNIRMETYQDRFMVSKQSNEFCLIIEKNMKETLAVTSKTGICMALKKSSVGWMKSYGGPDVTIVWRPLVIYHSKYRKCSAT